MDLLKICSLSSAKFLIVFLTTLLIRFQGKPACHAKGLRALEMLCFLFPCMQISQGAFPSHAYRPDHILSLCGCITPTLTQITTIQSIANKGPSRASSSFIQISKRLPLARCNSLCLLALFNASVSGSHMSSWIWSRLSLSLLPLCIKRIDAGKTYKSTHMQRYHTYRETNVPW